MLDLHETGAALSGASAVAQLSAQSIQIDLCGEQGFSEVGVALHFDNSAAVFLDDLDDVLLDRLWRVVGRDGGARAQHGARSALACCTVCWGEGGSVATGGDVGAAEG